MPPFSRARALSAVFAPDPASRLYRMWDEFARLVRLHEN